MVLLPEKGQTERYSSFPRSTNQGCQNMPTRITLWEIRHEKENKSEKLDTSSILLLALRQRPYRRAVSDIHADGLSAHYGQRDTFKFSPYLYITGFFTEF